MARQFTEQFKKDALSYVHDHSDLSIITYARNLGISAYSTWLGKKAKERDEVHRGSGNYESMRLKKILILGNNFEIRKMLLKS